MLAHHESVVTRTQMSSPGLTSVSTTATPSVVRISPTIASRTASAKDWEGSETAGDVVMRHGPWLSRDAYVAGPAVMVEDTVARLVGHGVRRERIRTEVFAPSRPGPSVDGEVTE